MLDKNTFENLFRKEFKGLVVFALGYVKDHETAKEIVQDAFISLWEKRLEIDLTKSIKAYLSTTVRNKALNHLRDNKKFDHNLLEIEGLSNESVFENPDTLEISELKERIDSAIDELPEKCREIFLLNRKEHLKYQEIADVLKISVKTVETQMSKALQHMRKYLREYLTIVLILIAAGIRVNLLLCV